MRHETITAGVLAQILDHAVGPSPSHGLQFREHERRDETLRAARRGTRAQRNHSPPCSLHAKSRV